MTDQEFERAVRTTLLEQAREHAPAALRVRVSQVPEAVSPRQHRALLAGGLRWALGIGVLAVVIAGIAVTFWAWYSPAAPATVGNSEGSPSSELVISTEPELGTLPSGARLGCGQAEILPVRVERSESKMVFVSVSMGVSLDLVWPHGFYAKLVDGKGELFEPDGTMVAREGDVLTHLGGERIAGTIHICSM
jgi:hypothetical protein